MNETNYISRPVWDRATIRGKRAEIWFYRRRSAWELAAIVCGEQVTESEYNAAAKLLDSCQRYAMADANEFERENSSERYCNSKYHMDRIKQLSARRDRLQKQLARYGLEMINYGLYPTIVNADRRDMGMLHYFD